MTAVSILKYRHLSKNIYDVNRILLLKQQNTYIIFYRCTHYETLRIKPEATQQEIKKAYIQLSKQIHPDVNNTDPHAHIKFTELTKAYELLSDPYQRKIYDVKMKFDKTIDDEIHKQYHTSRILYKDKNNQENFEKTNKIRQQQDSKLTKNMSILFMVQVCLVLVGIYFSVRHKSTSESQHVYRTTMLRGMHEFNEMQQKLMKYEKDVKITKDGQEYR